MRKNLYHLASLTLGLLVMSCNDSFMDRNPQTEIGVPSFFNTEEDLKMYCFNMYNFPDFGFYTDDSGTDNQATTDIIEVKNIMMASNPTSVTVQSDWNWDQLRTINLFLENCNRAAVSPDVLAHYQGVARFFRAEFYMDKVKRYSDVPWYDHTLSVSDEDLYKSRDSREFVVKKIFEDYQFAAEHVKPNLVPGIVNKWVVLTYMARHALYEGTYRKYHDELHLESTAEDFLKIASDKSLKIIEEGGFKLYNTGHPETDYHTLFESVDLSANSEVILGRFYDRKLYDNGFWAFMFGNYIPCPTKDLVQSYLMKDGSFYSSQIDYENKQYVAEFKDRDPRLSQTLAYPGWILENTMTYAPGAGVYVQNLNKNFSGYHQIKGFVNNKDEDFYLSVDIPLLRYAEVLLTFAEARAELGNLSQTDLDRSINLLRDRVGMPHLTLNPECDPFLQRKYPSVSPILLEIRRERRVELALEGRRYDDLMRWKAGKLLENEPEGIYFPSLGKFDLTGDGIEDIYLIPSNEDIPAEADKEVNLLGKKLTYYKTGFIDDTNATVYLKNGTSGNIITIKDMGKFIEPKYYYRPIPKHEMDLNPNLGPQLFGWE